MATNVHGISLIPEKLQFIHYFVRGVIYAGIDVLGNFSVFCSHEILVKLNLLIFVVLVRQREKSQRYFNLLDLN